MKPRMQLVTGVAALLLGGAAIFAVARDAPPIGAEIGAAYQAHLAGEAALPGMAKADAWHSGTPITATPIRCTPNGDGHFHCLVRFAVEDGGRRITQERLLHLVRDAEGDRWVVDSVEEPVIRPS